MPQEYTSPQFTQYFRRKITAWATSHTSDFPWRKSHNKWHSLVAEIMLQRTRAEQVVPVYEKFCIQYPSPSDYANAPSAATFSTLGLSWREVQLRALSQILSNKEIPANKQELLQLPGVGSYVASAYLSLHVGVREPIVDTNVVRLYGRFFGLSTDAETRRQKWIADLAERLTPARSFKIYNYAAIDFTRLVCKVRPLCDTCPLSRKCACLSQR